MRPDPDPSPDGRTLQAGRQPRGRSRRGAAHPTHARLVDQVLAFMEEMPVEAVSIDMVLAASGVSKGSLYHHFADFQDLIETALSRRFAASVDANIAALRKLFEGVHTRQDFHRAADAFNALTQSPDFAARRAERITIIARCAGNPRLRQLIAGEQARLTTEYEQLVREAQARGWVFPDLDAKAIAVFIQAYTLGRIVDDISAEQVDNMVWRNLLMQVIERGLGIVP